jgi:predicted nucleic acid-binding protein
VGRGHLPTSANVLAQPADNFISPLCRVRQQRHDAEQSEQCTPCSPLIPADAAAFLRVRSDSLGRILLAWSEGQVGVVFSPPILAEYREAGLELETKYGPTHFDSFVSLLLVHAELVDAPANLATPVCSSPDDYKSLACALVSFAKVIVSGDHALLAVNGWSELEVVRPRAFADLYLADTK